MRNKNTDTNTNSLTNTSNSLLLSTGVALALIRVITRRKEPGREHFTDQKSEELRLALEQIWCSGSIPSQVESSTGSVAKSQEARKC